jgi:hypothetical protein
MEAQAVGEDGRSIVRHRGIEILRTVPGRIAGRGSDSPRKKVSGEISPNARVVDAVRADTRVGDVLKPLSKTITAEQAAVFSRIGEYVHNIHDDLDIARAGGLKVPIVQGQPQAGCVAEYLARAFGKAWFTDGWFQVKFIGTLNVFDSMEITGRVAAITSEAQDRWKVELEVWMPISTCWRHCRLARHISTAARVGNWYEELCVRCKKLTPSTHVRLLVYLLV